MASIRIKGFLIDQTFAARWTVPRAAFDSVFLAGLLMTGGPIFMSRDMAQGALLIPYAAVAAALALIVLGLFVAALIRFGTPDDQVSHSSSTVVDFRRYLGFSCAVIALAALLKSFAGS